MKTDDLSETPVVYADARAMGRIVGQVYANADRTHFRLVVGGRIHAGFKGSWEGFMEHAQDGAPFHLRYEVRS